MEIERFKAFVSQNSTRIQNLTNRRDTSIGFNAFALVSDLYYRENFHSDVIRAILDPHSPHGEGTLFVRLFIKYLAQLARLQHEKDALSEALKKLSEDFPANDSVEVVREEGRVDIKIKIVRKADPQWTIIVENKINGACDMERQLPRYIKSCDERHEKVVAAVYLKASKEGRPDDNGWIKGDKKLVEGVLLSVAGYSEDPQICSLVEGWLEPCAAQAKSLNTKCVVSQYAELVVNHAGETMNQIEYKQIMDALGQFKVKYSQLAQIVNEMPFALAIYVAKKFNSPEFKKRYGGLLSKEVRVKGTSVIFDFKEIEIEAGPDKTAVSLGVELSCADFGGCGVAFYSQPPSTNNRMFLEPVLNGFNPKFTWDDHNGCMLLRYDRDEMFGNPDSLVSKMSELLDVISGNVEKFSANAAFGDS